MQCPKCRTENPDTITYCVRCHAPLKYTCPSCKHVQLQGGKCEKCGVDFAKYAAMLVFQAKDTLQAERKKAGWHPPLWAHIVFFPIPLVIQLTLYLVRKARGK
jgi:hypothetical protein